RAAMAMLPSMKRLLTLVVLGAVLTACGGTGTSSSAPAAGLAGTSWTLAEIDGREPAVDPAPTLAFDEELNASGSAGCNTFTGAAPVERSSISFGPLATTMMACPGAAGLLETAFLAAMNEVESFAI